jgi:hypothetical protein
LVSVFLYCSIILQKCCFLYDFMLMKVQLVLIGSGTKSLLVLL